MIAHTLSGWQMDDIAACDGWVDPKRPNSKMSERLRRWTQRLLSESGDGGDLLFRASCDLKCISICTADKCESPIESNRPLS